MWTLSSPLLMISSVKSFLVPNESRFTSSTIPLVFISVWRSYLVGIVSFCSAFCASTSCASTIWASTRSRHRSRNEEMADRDLAGLCDGLCHGLCHGLGDGTGTSRLCDTDPPRCLLKPGLLKPGLLKLAAVVFANDKAVYSVAG